jgi:hypothetical protein
VTNTSVTDTTWRLGSAAVLIAFAFDPLGDVPNIVVLAILLLAALQVLMGKSVADRENGVLLMLAAIIVVIAALEILHPNVPGLTVGLVGFRKSATFVLGVVIGLGWRGSRMQGLRLTWWCLLAIGAISLVVHFQLPAIEQLVSRSAGEFTSIISGSQRMQGLLAGPFHVSLLGAFLFLSSLTSSSVIRSSWVRVSAAAVGLGCLYFSQVRTGFVAIAVGVLVLAVTTGSVRKWGNRLLVMAASGFLAVVYVNPLSEAARRNAALRRLLDSGLDDDRFTARFSTWQASFDLVERSLLGGWGSGSSGDTLGPYFVGGEHVTAHNMFLKYAVEGGLIQGILFTALCIGLLFAVRPSRDSTGLGLSAALPLLVFGSVGSTVESLPVSLGLAVIWGLCAGQSESNAGPVSRTSREFAALRSGDLQEGSRRVVPVGR